MYVSRVRPDTAKSMTRDEASSLAAKLTELPPDEALARGMALLSGNFPEILLEPAKILLDRHPTDTRMAQMLGLAARASGESALAHRAFRAAAKLAPADALIAHSHARTALEAGAPASELFARASRLAPSDGSILQGMAAALFAERRADDALEMLSKTLAANPGWIDGHRTYAGIAAQLGHDPFLALSAAIAREPRSRDLHRTAIVTALEARDPQKASAAIDTARNELGSSSWLDLLAAHAASERGDLDIATALFSAQPPPATPSDAALLARHQIKSGRPAEAIRILGKWLGKPGEDILWPYLSLAWRMTNDPRAQWLEGHPSLIGVYDLADEIADIAGLADHLRALHLSKQPPLDQSVRGGTQTDGNLFLRGEQPIQALRTVVLDTVRQHVAALPPPQPHHPTLLARRDPLRIAGSWSVRLTGAGFHTDHVHPQGWFSSALYLALPDTLGPAGGEDAHAGWLSLGESRDLAPTLPPLRLVEPKFGRLVLFPSTMWHGTRPFSAGERLTVAFDIARPQQD